jgi:hypothetical protein
MQRVYAEEGYTQQNSVNNATISINPSLHDMFRPQTTVIRCFSYTKTVQMYRISAKYVYVISELQVPVT